MDYQDIDFSTMGHEVCLNGKFLQEIKKVINDAMVCVDYMEDGRVITRRNRIT